MKDNSDILPGKSVESINRKLHREVSSLKEALETANKDHEALKEKAGSFDFRLYEILDRAHTVQSQFWDTIGEHDVIDDYPELKGLVEVAGDALMNIYQYAGAEWFRQNPELFKKVELEDNKISDLEAELTEANQRVKELEDEIKGMYQDMAGASI